MTRRVALLLVGAAALVASPANGATPPENLPQTNVEPSFAAPLTHQMQTLFRAIRHDSTTLATTVFFPESAYLRMKTGVIRAPAGDYVTRLEYFYFLDLAAYRRRLVAGATSTLVRVEANARLARWITPGACENRIGYWHLPRVRLVVRRNHVIVSVAVASLISWRGLWYVVHLGPNPRRFNVGTVDDFRLGPGTPGPPGGC